MGWNGLCLKMMTDLGKEVRLRKVSIERGKNETPVLGSSIPVLGVKLKRG